MRTEPEKTNTQKIADFADKTLLIVDDDNPLRNRLARANLSLRGLSSSTISSDLSTKSVIF